jgi:TRAP-type mannitol/chloroaromatic compound transport system permease small subunit
MTALLRSLLKVSHMIDAFNERIARVLMFLTLLTVLVSAGNAIARRVYTSSNAFLELQWYLFGTLLLLCSAYTLLRNGHVRIDVVVDRLPLRARAWIDIFGTVAFLLPLCALMIYFGGPRFMSVWQSQETSGDAGALVKWPIWLMIPTGFTILALQGFSEVIKLSAFLRGLIPFPHAKKEKTDEEKLIEEIAAQKRGSD